MYKKGLLLVICIALLGSGSALLYQQWYSSSTSEQESRLNVVQSVEPVSTLSGAFTPETISRFAFRYDDKDVFNLLLTHYHDNNGVPMSAVLFPKETQDAAFSSSQTGLRHDIWQTVADMVTRHAPDNALILSWWDDGQRVHFLTGREAWLRHPAEPTLINPVWNALKKELPLAHGEMETRLQKIARWLTMDHQQALQEIVQFFGSSRPIYLLVHNDLLLRLAELEAYGGTPLNLLTKKIPAGSNLHGDIAQVKRWAHEAGDGNYLTHKEGQYYKTWLTRQDDAARNSLLVRLLPFVDSLKKLPEGVTLVYQSGWGGFLSIYQIETD